MAKNVNRKIDNNTKDTRHQYFNLDEDKGLFDEIDEDLRNEKFKHFINQYGGLMLTALIVVISIVVSYDKIKEWQVSKAENKTIQYIQAVAPSDKYENNIIELENIVNTEKGIFRDIAQLRIANILIENNQTDKGLDVASKIYNRHRLLKGFLISIGVSEQTAEDDACKIEHDLSDETIEAIKRIYDKN